MIAWIRLVQRGIQVDQLASFRLGHSLLKRFRDPGIIVFHHEPGDLGPFASGKSLELLDNFRRAHSTN